MLTLPAGIAIQIDNELSTALMAYIFHSYESNTVTLNFEPLDSIGNGPISHPIEIMICYNGDKWILNNITEYLRLSTTKYERQETLLNFNFAKQQGQLLGMAADEIDQFIAVFNTWQKNFLNYLRSGKYRVMLTQH
jgi:hypothetical protein